MRGHPVKREIGERSHPTANDGRGIAWRAFGNTYGPTGNHKNLLKRVKSQLVRVKSKLRNVAEMTMPAIERKLQAAGAPWIEGQGIIKN